MSNAMQMNTYYFLSQQHWSFLGDACSSVSHAPGLAQRPALPESSRALLLPQKCPPPMSISPRRRQEGTAMSVAEVPGNEIYHRGGLSSFSEPALPSQIPRGLQ